MEHFISTLRYDVNIVKKLPKHGRHRMTPFQVSMTKRYKITAHHCIFYDNNFSLQLNPPRDAPLTWYTTEALKKMKKHGAVYLTPFSHRLSEEIDDSELQRLRCRVNYHALRFKPQIIKISNNIVRQLREEGHFIALHLRFEKDMLAFAGYFYEFFALPLPLLVNCHVLYIYMDIPYNKSFMNKLVSLFDNLYQRCKIL